MSPSDNRPGVSIQTQDFDLSAEVAALRHQDHGVGAAVAFVGTVREWAQARAAAVDQFSATDDEAVEGGNMPSTPSLELEHYPGMTERSIGAMVDEARQRFDVRGVRVIHRVGPLGLGDQIVLVAVTSAHRHAAFQCCEFLMDWLKTDAPFWKKEWTGSEGHWVDARASDEAAAARWGARTPMPPEQAG